MSSTKTRFALGQQDIPTAWYNIAADFAEPMPPMLNPATNEPLDPAMMEAIFAKPIVEQEFSQERWIEMPEEVRDVLALWRPTPLLRSVRLEKALDTPAHIYYKYEGSSPAGSHKPNSAIPQAFYNKQAGIKRLATETGAGQWGSSLSLACQLFGLECTVYMVGSSYRQKPYRRMAMETWGATVHASPSMETEFGRRIRAEDPHTAGSLGIAISEAVEDTVKTPGTKYALGSVLNHVCLHQTVIGQEAIRQMEMAGEEPDVVIGCAGGGSNFAGIAFPFLRGKIVHGKKTRIVAVEPAACPSLTKGELRYDFGDTAMTTPLMKMFTLGADFMPPSLHAGGLRYHGMAPTVSHAFQQGLCEARAYEQHEVFEAATLFARAEGIIPAPESSHAIKAVIDEALEAKREGKKRVIVFNLSGHGLLDLPSFEAYRLGNMNA
jgi:tryptophan synthase beta chain